MLKIKKGDTVKVVAGKDKGKDGLVEKVFIDRSSVLVPNLNLYKKHVEKQPRHRIKKAEFLKYQSLFRLPMSLWFARSVKRLPELALK